MLLELHVLQNIAPANLNRDDTGSPKDAIFGGVRRARVSSQAWKRAMRTAFQQQHPLTDDKLAVRTKRVIGELTRSLADQGHDPAEAEAVALAMLGGIELSAAPNPNRPDDPTYYTQYLLYLGRDEIAKLATLAHDRWDDLAKIAAPVDSGKGRKKASKVAIPKDIQEATLKALDGSRAADLALFGRMLADLPERNIDGAAQVAHAISTHAVQFEYDYYTAVDDLNPADETGAGMIGTIEFNSATFYRYTNLDVSELAKNLGGDQELVTEAVRAYAQAFVTAIPTGKQNSFAAQNPPSAALAVLREHSRWSLANAFVQPIGLSDPRGLMQASIEEMIGYLDRLTGMYGDKGIVATPLLVDRAFESTPEQLAERARYDKPEIEVHGVGDMDQWLDEIERNLVTGETLVTAGGAA